MKKKFKTIMAMAAVAAISMSSICMASAVDIEPDINGDFVEQTADVYLTVENTYQVTLDWGAMKFTYNTKNSSWGENDFDQNNNKVSVTNQSTAPVNCTVTYGAEVIDTLNPDLFILNDGVSPSISYTTEIKESGNTADNVTYYLEVKGGETPNTSTWIKTFNNKKVGTISVQIEIPSGNEG